MARAAYRVHVSEPAALTHLPPTVQPVRAVVWLLHLALPMAGLWLLLARPQVDVVWHHSVAHFWLVVTVAAVNVAIGVRMSAAALNRGDPRLFLVSWPSSRVRASSWCTRWPRRGSCSTTPTSGSTSRNR
jgi:hypothetical protein